MEPVMARPVRRFADEDLRGTGDQPSTQSQDEQVC